MTLNQILFLLSGFQEPRRVLVERLASWPKSIITAGDRERRKSETEKTQHLLFPAHNLEQLFDVLYSKEEKSLQQEGMV